MSARELAFKQKLSGKGGWRPAGAQTESGSVRGNPKGGVKKGKGKDRDKGKDAGREKWGKGPYDRWQGASVRL